MRTSVCAGLGAGDMKIIDGQFIKVHISKLDRVAEKGLRMFRKPFCRCSRFMTFGATFLKFTYYFRIRLCFADFFKYRLCGLSLCIQHDSFLFNFVFSCRFCLSAFHSSNSLFPSSVSKSD